MIESPKWYKIDENAPLSKPYSGDKGYKYVLLGSAKNGPAIGFIMDLGDELKGVAGGYHGFEWTHWSPLPDGLPTEE
jgi:hypothetical protein